MNLRRAQPRAPRTADGCRAERGAPSTRPSAPRPASDATSDAGAVDDVRRLARSAEPRARSDAPSAARPRRPARRSRPRRRRSSGTTSTTSGSPRVSVPVLSKATQRTLPARSRCAPPLISTPLRAAPASAATIDTGVEITSAQGHETTSSTSAR